MNKKKDTRVVISGLELLELHLLVIQEIIQRGLGLAEKAVAVMLLRFGSRDNTKI
jgi:hypothetical protein